MVEENRHYRDGLHRPVCHRALFTRLRAVLDLSPIGGEAVTDREIAEGTFPDLPLRPAQPAAIARFRDRYLLKEVLRKYPGLELGLDTRNAAIESFRADEVRNSLTNERILHSVPEMDVEAIIMIARRKIAGVLGKFDGREALEKARHGPGATSRLRRNTSDISYKLSGNPHIHASALELAKAYLSVTPSWAYHLGDPAIEPVPSSPIKAVNLDQTLEVYNWDDVICVPKNAKTGRTISRAPDLSIFFQLGVGHCLRKRLYHHGIDLSDQGQNQIAAREASITGESATLDMKSASNSITCGLVLTLLGPDNGAVDPNWFNALELLRVPFYRLPGKTAPLQEYELFSAMGNGYTFELESLIFWALATATLEFLGKPSKVHVYGDDLVVPGSSVPLIRKVFAWLGIEFNLDKSFYDSDYDSALVHFRESCGKHYLGGFDVSPFYVDALLNTATEVILLANNLVRWAKLPVYGLDGRLASVWLWVVSHLKGDALSSCIPFGDEDDGLILPFEVAQPKVAYLGNPVITPPPGGTWCAVPRAPRGALRIGYSARTFSLSMDLKEEYEGQTHLMVWLYNSVKSRFQPPGAPPPFKGRPFWVTWLSGHASPQVCTPTKGVLVPKGTKKGRRVVPLWDHPGPWIDSDGYTVHSMATILLTSELTCS